jgi:hypothetical protein
VSELLSARNTPNRISKTTPSHLLSLATNVNMVLILKFRTTTIPRKDLKVQTQKGKLVALRIQQHGYVMLGQHDCAETTNISDDEQMATGETKD